MNSDTKILIAVVVIPLVVAIGLAVFLSKSPSQKATLQKTTGAKIQILEENFSFGDIPYSGGNVNKSYKIKNVGDKDVETANLATSCMCTQAYMKGPNFEGPKVGMKGMSKPSSWKGVLKPGEEGEIVVIFDPAFHGPQGIGPISRNVSFETNDPDIPYVELTFSGNVVK